MRLFVCLKCTWETHWLTLHGLHVSVGGGGLRGSTFPTLSSVGSAEQLQAVIAIRKYVKIFIIKTCWSKLRNKRLEPWRVVQLEIKCVRRVMRQSYYRPREFCRSRTFPLCGLGIIPPHASYRPLQAFFIPVPPGRSLDITNRAGVIYHMGSWSTCHQQ
jgi:hypothetical protein